MILTSNYMYKLCGTCKSYKITDQEIIIEIEDHKSGKVESGKYILDGRAEKAEDLKKYVSIGDSIEAWGKMDQDQFYISNLYKEYFNCGQWIGIL